MEFQRRRGRPAKVSIEDNVAIVRVGGLNFVFSIGTNDRLSPRGDTRDQKGTEDFAYARNLIIESLLSPAAP